MPWVSESLPHGRVIRPVDDLIVHTHTEECTCCPMVQVMGYSCGDGHGLHLATRKVITHQAMDGRD